MRATSLLLLAALCVGFSMAAAQDSKVDFSGAWVMNADKSDMGDMGGRGGRNSGGGMRGGGSGTMVVEMQDNKLIVQTTRMGRNSEEMTTTATYTLDGKKCNNETGRGTSVSTAVWSKDGTSITIKTETYMAMGDREFTMNSDAVWSMDGDALKIKTVRSTPRGDMKSTMVYDRQAEGK